MVHPHARSAAVCLGRVTYAVSFISDYFLFMSWDSFISHSKAGWQAAVSQCQALFLMVHSCTVSLGRVAHCH